MTSEAPDVLLLCMSSGIGGTEQSMRTLARGLVQHEVRCEAWLPTPLQRDDVVDWFAESGVPTQAGATFMAGWPRLLDAVRFFRRYRRSAVNIHLPWLTPSLSMIVALRLAGVRKIVISPHGADPTGIRRSTAMAYNLASAVAITTPYQKDLLVPVGVKPSKMVEIPLGVPAPPAEDRPLVPRDDSGRIVVGVLCRFVPLKRVDAVLRACAAVPGFKDRFRLLIGGNGPENEKLRALAAELPQVGAEFLGHVDEPWRFFQAIDLCVLVSELESFGLVYIEAAQQGVPSIGSRNGGVPYAVREGETGYLVDPADPEPELTKILDSLDQASLKSMGAAAKKHAERYTEAQYVAAYERAFK